jgi:ABC-2 type transport system ATP-binding protein
MSALSQQGGAIAERADSPLEVRSETTQPISVDHLFKRYGDTTAVADVSFDVGPGEIFGFLGPNGAGKTTTIRVLTGRARPTTGTAVVAGFDVVTERERLKPLINIVPEHQNLYERLTGRENLQFYARLYGAPASRVNELLGHVALQEASGRRVKHYSSGMKQRLLVARALINEPRILFLDEPTRGLDPISAREIHHLVSDLAAGGTTVFLTTHFMEEADELCDRVAILNEGRIVALDTPRELKLRVGRRSARVLLDDREEREVALDSSVDAALLARWMSEGQVLAMHSEEGTLDDVFIALAGRSLR